MKLSTTLFLLSLGLSSAQEDTPKYGLSFVRDISLPTPGFIELIGDELYLTSFNAEPWFLSKNGVYRMKAGDYETGEPELLTDELGTCTGLLLLTHQKEGDLRDVLISSTLPTTPSQTGPTT